MIKANNIIMNYKCRRNNNFKYPTFKRCPCVNRIKNFTQAMAIFTLFPLGF